MRKYLLFRIIKNMATLHNVLKNRGDNEIPLQK